MRIPSGKQVLATISSLTLAALTMVGASHLYGASSPGPAGTGFWQQQNGVNPGVVLTGDAGQHAGFCDGGFPCAMTGDFLPVTTAAFTIPAVGATTDNIPISAAAGVLSSGQAVEVVDPVGQSLYCVIFTDGGGTYSCQALTPSNDAGVTVASGATVLPASGSVTTTFLGNPTPGAGAKAFSYSIASNAKTLDLCGLPGAGGGSGSGAGGPGFNGDGGGGAGGGGGAPGGSAQFFCATNLPIGTWAQGGPPFFAGTVLNFTIAGSADGGGGGIPPSGTGLPGVAGDLDLMQVINPDGGTAIVYRWSASGVGGLGGLTGGGGADAGLGNGAAVGGGAGVAGTVYNGAGAGANGIVGGNGGSPGNVGANTAAGSVRQSVTFTGYNNPNVSGIIQLAGTIATGGAVNGGHAGGGAGGAGGSAGQGAEANPYGIPVATGGHGGLGGNGGAGDPSVGGAGQDGGACTDGHGGRGGGAPGGGGGGGAPNGVAGSGLPGCAGSEGAFAVVAHF